MKFKPGDYVELPVGGKYKVQFVGKDNICLVVDDARLSWRPYYVQGERAWHRIDRCQVSVIHASPGKLYAVRIETGDAAGKTTNVSEADLQPYTGQDENQEVASMQFGYSYYSVKEGQRTPRAMLYQAAVNKLAEVEGKPELAAGTVDGVTGPLFKESALQLQAYLGVAQDAIIGKNTWRSITAKLGDWRPPLRWRIAEQQNTFENGSRQNAFGAHNKVSFENWPNYGIWNANCMDGNMAGSGIGIMLKMAERTDLWQYDPEEPEKIADFLGSSAGRKVQLHDYMDRYIIQPAIDNLKAIGFDFPVDKAADLPDMLPSFWERLLALACDIAVNSGPVGMFSTRFPKVWDGEGVLVWDPAKLPDRDRCREIYGDVYGLVPSDPRKQFYSDRFSRDTSKEAMKRCMEACETDEQRINLLADLQARCISPRETGGPETLQDLVLRRRRCVGRLGGYRFQGVDFDSQAHFGIGM